MGKRTLRLTVAQRKKLEVVVSRPSQVSLSPEAKLADRSAPIEIREYSILFETFLIEFRLALKIGTAECRVHPPTTRGVWRSKCELGRPRMDGSLSAPYSPSARSTVPGPETVGTGASALLGPTTPVATSTRTAARAPVVPAAAGPARDRRMAPLAAAPGLPRARPRGQAQAQAPDPDPDRTPGPELRARVGWTAARGPLGPARVRPRPAVRRPMPSRLGTCSIRRASPQGQGA
jgi:hypothetical protein